jgi:photosystem II stability/assembly factor-like uncharacterized protein
MLKRLFSAALASAMVLSLTAEAAAQQARRAPAPAAPTGALVPGLDDGAILGQLQMRSIGPAVMSGRVSDIAVAVDPKDPPGTRLGRVFYITTPGAGVWKTVNGGKTFSSITDMLPAASFGAVAVAPTNPAIVYAGSGESNNLRSSSWGNGMYKSTDAGATWTHIGLTKSQHIGRIIVHPTNADLVYVAAGGPLWASGGERGLYKTTDGGRTWTNVLSRGPFTGVTDVAFDPRNADVLYAATYQRDRRAYSFVAGGPESGIFKSTDAGRNWTELKSGLPTGDKGRIGVSVSHSKPDTIYATVDAEGGGVYRSEDGGANWTRQSDITSIPWFFGQIRADPRLPDRVYHLGVALSVSDDAGVTWRRIAGNTHADHHALWIDPNDSNHMILGNDGGLYVSYDAGESWDFAVNLPISTFYAVSVDMQEPFYHVYGGLQDNGTWAGPSSTRSVRGIDNNDWYRVGGGDGFYSATDPNDPFTAYVESQNGVLSRLDVLTNERKSIRPTPPPGEPAYRFNWSAPLFLSPHDSHTLYFAANYLFRSRDRGDSWERLGPDLTRQLDRDKLPIMGLTGPGGWRRHEGTAEFGNISTIDESRFRAGLLVVGTDDGLVQISRDGGRNWTRIDQLPGVPEMTYVSRVVFSTHHEGTLYVTFDGHRSNDFKPYVLKSTDYGSTFTSIASNLPAEGSVHVIREGPNNPSLLFVGTEFGLFVSLNGGASWSPMRNGLPTTAVHDVVIHPRENDLVVGTHGRGIFILDDITPLEMLAATPAPAVAALASPRSTSIMSGVPETGIPGNRRFTGTNRAAGAQITYLVGTGVPAGAELSLAILDAAGEIVRTLPANSTPGLHRVAWNLRMEPPFAGQAAPGRPTEPSPSAEAQEEFQRPTPGQAMPAAQYVFPGPYRVQLRQGTAGGTPSVLAETNIEVHRDPFVRLSETEYRELHRIRMLANDTAREADELARRLRAAREKLSGSGPLHSTIDEILVGLQGPPVRGATAPVLHRAAEVGRALANTHFMPEPGQRQLLMSAENDLRALRDRAETALRQITTSAPVQ